MLPIRTLLVDAQKARFEDINGEGPYQVYLSGAIYVWRNVESNPITPNPINPLNPSMVIRDIGQDFGQKLHNKQFVRLHMRTELYAEGTDTYEVMAVLRMTLADVLLCIGQDRTWTYLSQKLARDTNPVSDETETINQAGKVVGRLIFNYDIDYVMNNYDSYTVTA